MKNKIQELKIYEDNPSALARNNRKKYLSLLKNIMNYSIENIEGITCIFAPMEEANSLTIQIMCKAGSIYESAQLNGIAHFQEHMFFKGGKKYPNQKAVTETIDRFGGEFNASTGTHGVSYYVKSAPNFAEQALDVLADMMMHAQFDPEEIEKEKGVIIQELKMYEDNPSMLVHNKRRQRYFGNSSYGRDIIGTIATINSFNQEKLISYKQGLYTKNNLIIVIAGKILNKESLIEQIKKNFKSLLEEATIMRPDFDYHLPIEKESFFEKKTEQNHLIIAARGFTGEQEQRYAARILATILGGNMSSRLFQNIRSKYGLCYYIGAAHSAKKEVGDFVIRAGIDKERFNFGVAKIFEEIEEISKGKIGLEEFENALGNLQGQLQMGIETSDEMADFLGGQYLEYQRIDTLEDMLSKYESVSFDEVLETAKLLEREHLYLYHIQ